MLPRDAAVARNAVRGHLKERSSSCGGMARCQAPSAVSLARGQGSVEVRCLPGIVARIAGKVEHVV